MLKFVSLSCLVLFALVNGQLRPKVITVTNGGTEGRWGDLESCPPGSRAVTYQTQNEINAPVVDDSALNTITLFCDDPLATNITSSVG